MIDPPNHHGHLRAANLVVYPIIWDFGWIMLWDDPAEISQRKGEA